MMLKTLAGSLALVALVTAPPSAGLKYSVHMEMRQGANAAQDQMSAMMAPIVMQIFPAGGLDQAVTVGDKGIRTEQKQAFAGAPAGAITITRPDGTSVVIDPAAKTFWKQTVTQDAAAQMQQMGLKPDIKVVKTGQFETIEGMKAERIDVTIAMSLPGVDPAQVPPGFPSQITMGMAVWVTDAIKSPGSAASMSDAMLAKFGMSDVSGLKELNDGRFMLKQVMTMFGVDMVTSVKDITKGDVADTLFEVPKDFKEIAAPRVGGGDAPPGRVLVPVSALAR